MLAIQKAATVFVSYLSSQYGLHCFPPSPSPAKGWVVCVYGVLTDQCQRGDAETDRRAVGCLQRDLRAGV